MHNTIHQSQEPRAGVPLGQSRPMPVELAAVALIDAVTCAVAGGMSVSWWYEEVRAGRAPAPAIQQVRCTRWRMAQVVQFWTERASLGASDAAMSTARAKKASDAASAKREHDRNLAATAE